MKVLAPQALAPTTKSVAPTETTLCEIDVSQTGDIALQVENLDASQDIALLLYEKLNTSNGYGPSEVTLGPVLPLTSTPVLKYRCGGVALLKVTGRASGAGAQARITARRISL